MRELSETRKSRNCCFFFQAEDGIRDYKVTGVQTCALPISHEVVTDLRTHLQAHVLGKEATLAVADFLYSPDQLPQGFADTHHLAEALVATRSEEHTSELQSPCNLVCRLLLEKKKNIVKKLL